jgi:hypothetical protein
MLAKLAAAAAPLYHQTEEECQALLSTLSSNSASSSISSSLSPDKLLSLQQHLQHWNDSVRAWGMWMSALAEHHQSIVFQEKQDWGLELARLDTALKYARLTAQFVHDSHINSDSSNSGNNGNGSDNLLDGLQQQVETILPNGIARAAGHQRQ